MQGDGVWWSAFRAGKLSHGRPHAVLFSRSSRVVLSNVTIRDSPFWTVRFWASQQLRVSQLTVFGSSYSAGEAHGDAENNDGVDVDSSRDVVIEDFYYDGGDDGVAIKSGMCQAGADFNMPSVNVKVQRVEARTRSSCFVTGSEDQAAPPFSDAS